LTAKLGEAVDIAHLARLPQQLTKRSHLSVDGSVAVAASAKGANHAVKHFLTENAEPGVQEYLVYLLDEGTHVVFVLTILPEYVLVSSV
jgi:hypothetical protein